jgi:hypothetical protein
MMTVKVDRGRWIPVKSLDEASTVVRRFIEDVGMGGSEWYGRIGTGRGAAVREGRKTVAYVSYNGRLWDLDRNEIVAAIYAKPYGLKTNPPRPTLDESLWRVRANETPLGPSWSDWYYDVVRAMSPTVFTDTDLNAYRSGEGR